MTDVMKYPVAIPSTFTSCDLYKFMVDDLQVKNKFVQDEDTTEEKIGKKVEHKERCKLASETKKTIMVNSLPENGSIGESDADLLSDELKKLDLSNEELVDENEIVCRGPMGKDRLEEKPYGRNLTKKSRVSTPSTYPMNILPSDVLEAVQQPNNYYINGDAYCNENASVAASSQTLEVSQAVQQTSNFYGRSDNSRHSELVLEKNITINPQNQECTGDLNTKYTMKSGMVQVSVYSSNACSSSQKTVLDPFSTTDDSMDTKSESFSWANKESEHFLSVDMPSVSAIEDNANNEESQRNSLTMTENFLTKLNKEDNSSHGLKRTNHQHKSFAPVADYQNPSNSISNKNDKPKNDRSTSAFCNAISEPPTKASLPNFSTFSNRMSNNDRFNDDVQHLLHRKVNDLSEESSSNAGIAANDLNLIEASSPEKFLNTSNRLPYFADKIRNATSGHPSVNNLNINTENSLISSNAMEMPYNINISTADFWPQPTQNAKESVSTSSVKSCESPSLSDNGGVLSPSILSVDNLNINEPRLTFGPENPLLLFDDDVNGNIVLDNSHVEDFGLKGNVSPASNSGSEVFSSCVSPIYNDPSVKPVICTSSPLSASSDNFTTRNSSDQLADINPEYYSVFSDSNSVESYGIVSPAQPTSPAKSMSSASVVSYDQLSCSPVGNIPSVKPVICTSNPLSASSDNSTILNSSDQLAEINPNYYSVFSESNSVESYGGVSPAQPTSPAKSTSSASAGSYDQLSCSPVGNNPSAKPAICASNPLSASSDIFTILNSSNQFAEINAGHYFGLNGNEFVKSNNYDFNASSAGVSPAQPFSQTQLLPSTLSASYDDLSRLPVGNENIPFSVNGGNVAQSSAMDKNMTTHVAASKVNLTGEPVLCPSSMNFDQMVISSDANGGLNSATSNKFINAAHYPTSILNDTSRLYDHNVSSAGASPAHPMSPAETCALPVSNASNKNLDHQQSTSSLTIKPVPNENKASSSTSAQSFQTRTNAIQRNLRRISPKSEPKKDYVSQLIRRIDAPTRNSYFLNAFEPSIEALLALDSHKNTRIHEMVRRKMIYTTIFVIRRLKQENRAFDLPNDNGKTPLFLAVEYVKEDPLFIKSLIELGCNPNVTDHDSLKTPLHYAARDGSIDIVKALLEFQITEILADENGETALHTAVTNHGSVRGDNVKVDSIPVIESLLCSKFGKKLIDEKNKANDTAFTLSLKMKKMKDLPESEHVRLVAAINRYHPEISSNDRSIIKMCPLEVQTCIPKSKRKQKQKL